MVMRVIVSVLAANASTALDAVAEDGPIPPRARVVFVLAPFGSARTPSWRDRTSKVRNQTIS